VKVVVVADTNRETSSAWSEIREKNQPMRIAATPLTATLAGVWTVMGMSMFTDALLAHRFSPWRTSLAFLAQAIVFFLIPVKLFVEGFDSKRRGWRYYLGFSRRYWREVPGVLLRSVFWFVGIVVGAAVLSFFERK